jgi:small-conductance mechanosensitive channel
MELMEQVRTVLSFSLLRLGAVNLTVGVVLFLIIGLTLLVPLSKALQRWVARGILAHTRMEVGAREAVGSIVRYFFLVLGFFVIIQVAGIPMTAFAVVAGAVGLGVGFGLQTIASNFISGIIIMFERPVKVGDRIEVGEVHGKVTAINARATTVLTNDNISVIVPNSRFISENVVNWTHSGNLVRFRVPALVPYGSDARRIERLLLEAAERCPDVLQRPEPSVRLSGFSDNGLTFELLVWSSTLVHRKGKLMSDVNFLIYDVFRQNGVDIPFPQRDVHIRSSLNAVPPG